PLPPPIYTLSLHDALPISFFALPNPAPSSASDDRTPEDLMPLAQDDNLASWNPHVECGAVRATIPYLLGPAYPNQQATGAPYHRSEEHTSELQSRSDLVCR